MLSPKIEMTDKLIHYIQSTRIEKGITASDLSSKIGRTVSYISSLENRRIARAVTKDLIGIFMELDSCSEEESVLKIESLVDSDPVPLSNNITDKDLDLGSVEKAKISELRKYSSFIEDEEIKEFEAQKKFILKSLDAMYEKMPEDTVRVLRTFCSNLKFNMSFTIGVASMPFSVIEDLDEDVCPEIYKKMSNVFMEYTNRDKFRVCKLTFEDGNMGEESKDGRPDLYIRREDL